MIGAGKYDDETTMVREATQARGVVLIVTGGNKGEGFSVQGTLDVLLTLPSVLRQVADQIETDMKQTMTSDKRSKERLVQDIAEVMDGDDGDLLELALKMMTIVQLEELEADIKRRLKR